MSVKGQLNACRDSLMAGMRARRAVPHRTRRPRGSSAPAWISSSISRGQSANVTTAEVETTLGVCTSRPYGGAGQPRSARANAATVALKNAIGRSESRSGCEIGAEVAAPARSR